MGEDVLDAYRQLVQENPMSRPLERLVWITTMRMCPGSSKSSASVPKALARELDLPVIVHEREAHEDALEILAEFPQVTRGVPLLLRLGGNGQAPGVQGLVHWVHRSHHL